MQKHPLLTLLLQPKWLTHTLVPLTAVHTNLCPLIYYAPLYHFIAKKCSLPYSNCRHKIGVIYKDLATSFHSKIGKKMWNMWSSFFLLGLPEHGSHYRFGDGGHWLADRTMWYTPCDLQWSHDLQTTWPDITQLTYFQGQSLKIEQIEPCDLQWPHDLQTTWPDITKLTCFQGQSLKIEVNAVQLNSHRSMSVDEAFIVWQRFCEPCQMKNWTLSTHRVLGVQLILTPKTQWCQLSACWLPVYLSF